MHNYLLYVNLSLLTICIGPLLTMILNSMYNLYKNNNKENLVDILFYLSLYFFGFWNTSIYFLIIKLHDMIYNYDIVCKKINDIVQLCLNNVDAKSQEKIESFSKIIKSFVIENNLEYYINYFNAFVDKLVDLFVFYITSSSTGNRFERYKQILTYYYDQIIPPTIIKQHAVNDLQKVNLTEINKLMQSHNDSTQFDLTSLIEMDKLMESSKRHLHQPLNMDTIFDQTKLEEINKLMTTLGDLQRIAENFDNSDSKSINTKTTRLTRSQRRLLKNKNKK